MNISKTEYPTDWTEYELIDSGNEAKLERFGSYTIVRPDPRILWQPTQDKSVWDNADAIFTRGQDLDGTWTIRTSVPDPWTIQYKNLVFTLRPTDFKHVGVFPEQAANWEWMKRVIGGRPLRVLNLFAYSGGATMAALSSGAHVTHVDSAKGALEWATQNVQASGLSNKPVRWICDDAYKFALREVKRGARYDGIIMDPPRFGRGTKGEVWKLSDNLPKLMAVCRELLSTTPAFFLLNAYTADLSPYVLKYLVDDCMKAHQGSTEFGELTLRQTQGSTGFTSTEVRLVPAGIFARWSR